MSTLIWLAFAAIAAALVAADVLKDRARQRREDREWTELVRTLEDQ